MQVRYDGEADGSSANDLTIGMVYACKDDCVDQAYINITADDVGDKHCVAKANCTLLGSLDPDYGDDPAATPTPKKKVFGKKQRQDDLGVPPDPYPVDDFLWEEDDDYTPPDPADYLAPGIQVIARDVEPVPDGPKSTDELRKYRFKPDTF